VDFNIIPRYLKYWLNAIEEHSLHSPFIYELFTQIIKPEYPDPHFERIEKIRSRLLQDTSILDLNDLGAGSKMKSGNRKTIAEIASTASSPPKLSKLIYRLIRQNECKEVVELGTCLGINTLYMQAGYEKINLTTFEGDETLAEFAENLFESEGIENIRIIKGDLKKTLSDFLAFSKKIDFAYLDANHTYEATIKYFNLLAKKSHDDSLFVVGDIHWSSEMEKAWKEIKESPYVTISIDIFHAGIVYFKPDILKQHYVLEF